MRSVLVLTLALVAAGCIGPSEPVESASVTPTGVAAEAAGLVGAVLDRNASVDAPEWRVGDAWTIESTGVGDAGPATLVVVAADAGSYQVRPSSEDLATFDAMFDISYVGRVRASDLAGHQQDQPVKFFDFPLRDGSAWSTTWDGLDVSLRAGFQPAIPTPLGPQPGFVIQGTTADGATYVEYDYVPALKWWSHLHFTEGYGFQVTGASSNWTGQYAVATAKTLLALASGAGAPAGTFTVDAEQTAVAMLLAGGAEAFVRGLVVVDPDNTEHAGPDVEASPTPAGTFEVVLLPGKAGQWKVAAPAAHPPGGGFTLTFHQVAVQKLAL
ncbi:MAG TPA: hypothetical protein VNX21_00565 [Candidatus Thermoplasmatota archaeon]|nr:hypothetical protein [Candidatus Thermoplasmatota archaeon]